MGDCEPESDARHARYTRSAIVRCEHRGKLAGGDPRPCVHHTHLAPFAAGRGDRGRGDRYASILRSKLHGVTDKVDQYLADATLVGVNDRPADFSNLER